MPKKKEVKKIVKKEVKVVKPKIETLSKELVTPDLKAIAEKRNALIAEIQPKLLTNSQLKQGGSNMRTRYALEKGYEAVLPEINELGAKLSLRPIGLGHLRK